MEITVKLDKGEKIHPGLMNYTSGIKWILHSEIYH